MEKEKKILVSNGLNNEFYSDLKEQMMDDSMEDTMIELATEDSVEEAMIEQMMETSMEEAMIEQMMQASMEEAMIEQMMQASMEEAMMEAALEDAMIQSMMEAAMEDAMIENQYGSASAPDKKEDLWIAVYKDYSVKSSEDKNKLPIENLLCFIYKKFEKTSKSGKTAYFSYQILDVNNQPSQLKIGNYYCEMAETEHWTSWDYAGSSIEENHFLASEHRNNNMFKFTRTFIYPIDYTFASLIPLSDYNPKHFSFRKLNFMSKGDTTSSGDKLSRLRIKDSKDRYLELSIFDFEKNIIGLLKELNKSASFIDFIIKSQLNHAVDYLNTIHSDLKNGKQEYALIAYKNICDAVEKILDQNLTFLPQQVKNKMINDANSLLNQYNGLKEKIAELT